MSEPLRLAVFDCDGTLVDSQHSIISCMHASFDAEGLPRAEDEAVRRVVGLPLLDAIAVLRPEAPAAAVARLKDGYGRAWRELRRTRGLDEPLYQGAVEALEAVSGRGWLLGVATGKSHRGLVGTLEKHDVLERFATLQTADRARGKPHPEMLIKAMDETGAEPSRTVMIGDTTFDMEMAASAGVAGVGVAWGYHDVHELKRSGARRVIRKYEELPGVLDSLMRE